MCPFIFPKDSKKFKIQNFSPPQMTRPKFFAPPFATRPKFFAPPPWNQKLKVPKTPQKHKKSGFRELKKILTKSKIFRPPWRLVQNFPLPLTACPKFSAPLRDASKILRPPGGVPPHPINNEPSLSWLLLSPILLFVAYLIIWFFLCGVLRWSFL